MSGNRLEFPPRSQSDMVKQLNERSGGVKVIELTSLEKARSHTGQLPLAGFADGDGRQFYVAMDYSPMETALTMRRSDYMGVPDLPNYLIRPKDIKAYRLNSDDIIDLQKGSADREVIMRLSVEDMATEEEKVWDKGLSLGDFLKVLCRAEFVEPKKYASTSAVLAHPLVILPLEENEWIFLGSPDTTKAFIWTVDPSSQLTVMFRKVIGKLIDAGYFTAENIEGIDVKWPEGKSPKDRFLELLRERTLQSLAEQERQASESKRSRRPLFDGLGRLTRSDRASRMQASAISLVDRQLAELTPTQIAEMRLALPQTLKGMLSEMDYASLRELAVSYLGPVSGYGIFENLRTEDDVSLPVDMHEAELPPFAHLGNLKHLLEVEGDSDPDYLAKISAEMVAVQDGLLARAGKRMDGEVMKEAVQALNNAAGRIRERAMQAEVRPKGYYLFTESVPDEMTFSQVLERLLSEFGLDKRVGDFISRGAWISRSNDRIDLEIGWRIAIDKISGLTWLQKIGGVLEVRNGFTKLSLFVTDILPGGEKNIRAVHLTNEKIKRYRAHGVIGGTYGDYSLQDYDDETQETAKRVLWEVNYDKKRIEDGYEIQEGKGKIKADRGVSVHPSGLHFLPANYRNWINNREIASLADKLKPAMEEERTGSDYISVKEIEGLFPV